MEHLNYSHLRDAIRGSCIARLALIKAELEDIGHIEAATLVDAAMLVLGVVGSENLAPL
ncbi:hypothetical protein [Novosphingobium lentum]|uniref:hypothetical protein n=1 Tax=Novosphingobium lentum TaxID=145287 RepID=UPI000B272701|nr:hypothetical protein [Novosphingobium lentum]